MAIQSVLSSTCETKMFPSRSRRNDFLLQEEKEQLGLKRGLITKFSQLRGLRALVPGRALPLSSQREPPPRVDMGWTGECRLPSEAGESCALCIEGHTMSFTASTGTELYSEAETNKTGASPCEVNGSWGQNC